MHYQAKNAFKIGNSKGNKNNDSINAKKFPGMTKVHDTKLKFVVKKQPTIYFDKETKLLNELNNYHCNN